MAEQSGSLAWNISGPSLTKFLSSPNGAEFTSETFNAGSFTFQCKVYPNGRKKEQKGCVMLYFVLQSSLTNQMSKITVKARLYCPQTLCDWKHIQHLKKDNAGIGWHSQNMLLSEAQQHSHLKFLCQITILRIEYQSSPKAALDVDTSSLGVNIYHKLSKMNVSTVHQWEMNRKLLDSFRAAHCGKFYHSMDYNWDSFCTSVAPNGGNARDAGNVKCGIQLLQLPAGIGKIKCKFSICCNVGNLQCDGKKEFSYNSTFIAWGDGTLTTKDLLNTTGTVHFRVTITITKCFDEFHHEIPRSSWHKYGVINHKEDGNNINHTQSATAKMHSDPLDTVGIGGADTSSHLDPTAHTKNLFLSLSQHRDRDRDRGRSTAASPNHSNSRSNMVTKPRGASVPRLDSEEHHRIRTQITNRRAPPVPPPRALQNGVAAIAATTGGSAVQSQPSNINKPQRPQPSRSRAKSKATVLDRKQKSPLKRQYTEGIRANESKIDAQSRNLQDVIERIDLMESHRSEDREYLVEVEENVMNLQKSQHRIQQKQFAMLKECIHELQATVQRLSHELICSQNRIEKLEKDRSAMSRDEEDHFEMKEGDRKSPTKLKVKKSNDASKSTAFRLKSGSKRNQKNSKRAMAVSSALAMWLSHDCGFPQYIGCFVSNGYDRLEIIKEMTRAELDEIGITLKGHQFKIAKEIEKLQRQQKHHRAVGRPFVANGDRDGDHFDLEHVATFLTPADSPALPHSPMFTLPARRGRVNSVPMLSPSAKEQSPSMYSHSKLFLNLDASQHGNHALHQSDPLHNTSYRGDSGKADGGTTGKHGDDDGLPDLKDRDEPKASTARWSKPQRAQAVHGPFGGGAGVRGPTVTANMNMNVNVNMSPTDSTSSYTATATGTTEFGPNKRFLLESPRRSHGPNPYPFSNQTRQRHLQLLDMWECGQCQNHNLGTLWKCEFCGRER